MPHESKKRSKRAPHTLKDMGSLELPDDFILSEEFLAAFQALEYSSKCMYITGEAGTGKTTLLKYFRKNSKKNIAVVAPTGIAAINSHGQTIHSFFNFPHKLIQKDQIRPVRNKQKKLFAALQMLIIDEASMMRADLMDGIDYALRLNKEKMNIPFGGVQVVLFGDLYQLPPIIDRELVSYYKSLYPTPYFFSAKIFSQVPFEVITLNTIYRQQDPVFINLLNKMRSKSLDASDLEALNSNVNPPGSGFSENFITLTPTNAAAHAINSIRLSNLSDEEFIYEAIIEGAFDQSSYPTETQLRLKIGAQVLMIKNDPEKRWVNGSIGEVVALHAASIQVRIKDEVYQVSRSIWQKIKYKYDRESEKLTEDVSGSFEQYPVKLAWAITIHKSQGLTFDKCIVDLGSGAFSHGQVYVALSRCRSREGLILKRPISSRDIIFDERVMEFPGKLNSDLSTTYEPEPIDTELEFLFDNEID